VLLVQAMELSGPRWIVGVKFLFLYLKVF
jgi:hypothetical protein